MRALGRSLLVAMLLCGVTVADAEAKGLMDRWRGFTGRSKTTITEKYHNLRGLTVGGNAGWLTYLGITAFKVGTSGDPVLAGAYGAFAGYNLFRGVSKARTLVTLPPEKPSKKYISAAANGALAVGLGIAAFYTGNPLLWGFASCNAVNCAFKLMNRFPAVSN